MVKNGSWRQQKKDESYIFIPYYNLCLFIGRNLDQKYSVTVKRYILIPIILLIV